MVFWDIFPLLGDIHRPLALGVTGAAEERAKPAVTDLHFGVADRAGLLPIEVGVVVLLIEAHLLNRSRVVAIGVARAAVEVL